MTIATAPHSLETGRSHLQESLFSWLVPEGPPVPTPAPSSTPEPEQKAAPRPEPPAAKGEAPDLSHVWVVAAEVEVTPKIAKTADCRGSFKATEGQRIDALEVYCKGCRRPYDEVTGQDCAAKIDNRHLIGGDQSTRAKRKIPVPPKNARVVPGGTIQRRGIGAYMSGVSRPAR
ncbi:hypothetical protein ACFY1J_05215 [Streptomyces sp. NPDC001406]|uniref:hypothetical protein n=1 Tax=Streptomyces sp. NPDC001406 TaxID=3364572 RepID=UPI0036B272C8